MKKTTYSNSNSNSKAARSQTPNERSHEVQPHPKKVHIELTNPEAHKVCVAGNFNDWKPEAGEMEKAGKGKWAKDLKLPPGTYEYRLVVDDQWMPDPNAEQAIANPYGGTNSVLTVP